jgi:hypothetical protein
MQKYLPVFLIVLIGVGVVFGVKRMRTTQNESSIAPLTTTVIPTTEANSETTYPTVTGTVSRGAEITLTVNSPSDNTTVTSDRLVVRGKTVAGAEVFVNDAETKADQSGNFSVTITLDEGENYILVVANDALGNYSEKEITVIYEAN